MCECILCFRQSSELTGSQPSVATFVQGRQGKEEEPITPGPGPIRVATALLLSNPSQAWPVESVPSSRPPQPSTVRLHHTCFLLWFYVFVAAVCALFPDVIDNGRTLKNRTTHPEWESERVQLTFWFFFLFWVFTPSQHLKTTERGNLAILTGRVTENY